MYADSYCETYFHMELQYLFFVQDLTFHSWLFSILPIILHPYLPGNLLHLLSTVVKKVLIPLAEIIEPLFWFTGFQPTPVASAPAQKEPLAFLTGRRMIVGT